VFIDVIEEIKTIEKDPDNLCILMWDANESINNRYGALRRLMSETTLVETFSQVAGDLGEIPTHSRGKKRLDYIMTSQALVPYVSRVRYLAFCESNLSDHQGLFMNISDSILGKKVTLTRPSIRHIGL
jgi:endonuclease/exonuclease/phosphatase family metal-dependent hydrolase